MAGKLQTQSLFAFDGNGCFTVFFCGILSVYQIEFEANVASLSVCYFISILSQI
jgi:hypothetical protein